MKRILEWVKVIALGWFSLVLAGYTFMYLWPLIQTLLPMIDRVALVVLGLIVLVAYQASVWPGLWRKMWELIDRG